MKKSTILAVFATTGLSVTAVAQPGPGDPWGDATVARTDAEAKAAERFAVFDTDKDGIIGEKEEDAAAQIPGGRGLGRADYDGDGKITRNEYIAAQLRRFDSQDGDKDGQLTKAERDTARQARMREGGGWGGPPSEQ